VYNQLLGIKLQAVSLWVALVYLDTESLWQPACHRTAQARQAGANDHTRERCEAF